MAKPTTLPRQRQSLRDRRAKAYLLPMPRDAADELSLRVHIALDAMRRGKGCPSAAQALLQATLFSAFLGRAGYGGASPSDLDRAEDAISAAFDRGCDTGTWAMDEETVALFAGVVTNFDRQLRQAPLSAVAEASDSFDRMQAKAASGKSGH